MQNWGIAGECDGIFVLGCPEVEGHAGEREAFGIQPIQISEGAAEGVGGPESVYEGGAECGGFSAENGELSRVGDLAADIEPDLIRAGIQDHPRGRRRGGVGLYSQNDSHDRQGEQGNPRMYPSSHFALLLIKTVSVIRPVEGAEITQVRDPDQRPTTDTGQLFPCRLVIRAQKKRAHRIGVSRLPYLIIVGI